MTRNEFYSARRAFRRRLSELQDDYFSREWLTEVTPDEVSYAYRAVDWLEQRQNSQAAGMSPRMAFFASRF